MQTESEYIVIVRNDGAVAIMQFVTKGRLNEIDSFEREATVEAISAEIAATQAAGVVASWRRIDPGDVPADRTFRGAWRDADGAVVVDMPTARSIHRGRLRTARAPRLAELDIEYQRADEQGDEVRKSQVTAQKQALRDLPDDPAIEAAVTPEELLATWPLLLG